MQGYSTREAAKELGISFTSMNRYIAGKKIPVPDVQQFGGGKLRIWTNADIEHVRKLLPKIKNGRKTRYQKKKKPQARAPAPHKQQQKKKKK